MAAMPALVELEGSFGSGGSGHGDSSHTEGSIIVETTSRRRGSHYLTLIPEIS
jgi:hypothetical protein